MDTCMRFSRGATILVVLGALLGTLQPLQPALAAPSGQEGTVHWGSIPVTASAPRQLTTTSVKPSAPLQGAAIPLTRMPGPGTAPADGSAPPISDASIPESGPPGPRPKLPGTFTIFADNTLVGATGVDSSAQAVEPSAANNGPVIFTSYNFYAARSNNYGTSWDYINPTQVSAAFCCDQDVLYDPSFGVTYWLVMDEPYWDADVDPPSTDNDGNLLHLAVFRSQADLINGLLIQYVIDPKDYCGSGVGTDEDWFDYPHLAVTSNYLYILSNSFRMNSTNPGTSTYTCTTVIRILLDDPPTGAINTDFYADTSLFNFTAAHGGTDRFYFATHVDADTLNVYNWVEYDDPGSVTVTPIDHTEYLVEAAPGFPAGGYDCTAAGAPTNPCGYEDDRIMSGWLRRDTSQLTFMWDAPQGTDPQGDFAWPRIRYVMLDVTSGAEPLSAPLEDSAIYNDDYAFFLPAAGVNTRGHVGGMAAISGGTLASPVHPGCVAWLYDDYTSSLLPLDSHEVTVALGDPDGDRWGDFYRVRMNGLNAAQWIGACYAVEEAGVVPHIVSFGRERDAVSHLFADVPVAGKEWMEPWIEAFYYEGITTGCGLDPLIYCPEQPVTRASMAVFILRAMDGPTYEPPPADHYFDDMPVAGKEWMEPWVDEFYRRGLTTGCGIGPLRFCPESPATRAAMAVFLLRALEGFAYTPPPSTHTFSDLPVAGKEWMEPWVDEFYTRGITTGCGVAPLIYCPENTATRASMAVFIDRAFLLYP